MGRAVPDARNDPRIRERAAGDIREAEEILRRHADYIRDLAEEAEPHLRSEDQTRWLTRLERELDNVRAALDWTESVPDAPTALRTAAALWRFWHRRGHLAEGRARLERALSLPGAEVRDAVRVRALGALGGVTYSQGDYEATRGPYEEAAEIAREIGDRQLLSRAIFDLAFLPFVTELDFNRGELLLQEALAESADDDRALHARIWSNLDFFAYSGGTGLQPASFWLRGPSRSTESSATASRSARLSWGSPDSGSRTANSMWLGTSCVRPSGCSLNRRVPR